MTSANSQSVSVPPVAYLPHVDGLRAMAVGLVVLYHAFPGRLPGGFIGVDIFFVISGYLIAKVVFSEDSRREFSVLDFYVRRVVRLFPALILVIFSALTFGYFSLLADEYQELGRHALGGLFFFANFLNWFQAGYFDFDAFEKPFLHLWSLGVEEQFYLVFPLAIISLRNAPRRRGIMFFLALGASFFYSLLLSAEDSVAAFYSPLSRAWELGVGILLASLERSGAFFRLRASLNNVYGELASVASIIIITFGAFYLSESSAFPGPWGLVPVLGAAAIIFLGEQSVLLQLLLSTRIAVTLGKISYPVYLWHWPLLSFLEIIEREKPWWGYRALALIFALALSVLTYKFLEKPLRASAKRKRSAPWLLLMALLIATLSFYVFKHEGIPSRPAVQNSEFSQAVRHQFMGPLWKYEKNDLCNTEYPFPGAEDLAWWFCMKSDDRPPTILLLGNSHANHLYPGFAMNPAFSHHTILSIGTCAVGVDGHRAEARNPCAGERVAQQKKFIDDLLAAEPTIRHVVIGGIRPSGEKQYVTRVVNRIKALSEKGYRIIIFYPHLEAQFNPKACFRAPLKLPHGDCFFDRSKIEKPSVEFSEVERAVRAAAPNTLFFDPNEVYCDPMQEQCAFRRGDLPILRDRTHFSEFGSRLVQQHFIAWAKRYAPSLFQE